MRAMLAACLTLDGNGPEVIGPEVDNVHQLRTGTRRVEATLEILAREAGARGLGMETEQVRLRWLRQLKKVRQASGAVRDLDVHRELLAEHYLPNDANSAAAVADVQSAEATSAEEVETDPAALLRAQAHALDAWLASRRETAIHALRDALRGREAKLVAVEQAFVSAFAKRRSAARSTHRSAARLSLEDYLRLMDAMPHLDAANLHDFRKGAKKARYVAEADDDDAAVAMTKAIKRVQDAIGDWHDWEVLAEESREALGEAGVVLEKDLDRNVKRAYDRALRTAATMGRRFVGEWQAVRPIRSRSSQAAKQQSR